MAPKHTHGRLLGSPCVEKHHSWCGRSRAWIRRARLKTGSHVGDAVAVDVAGNEVVRSTWIRCCAYWRLRLRIISASRKTAVTSASGSDRLSAGSVPRRPACSSRLVGGVRERGACACGGERLPVRRSGEDRLECRWRLVGGDREILCRLLRGGDGLLRLRCWLWWLCRPFCPLPRPFSCVCLEAGALLLERSLLFPAPFREADAFPFPPETCGGGISGCLGFVRECIAL